MCPDHLVSKQDMHYLQLRSYINDSWKMKACVGGYVILHLYPSRTFCIWEFFFNIIIEKAIYYSRKF